MMPISQPSASKVALITGGGSGIGLASAKALAEEGYTVVITGRRQDVLAEAVAGMPEGKAYAVVCDVTQPDSVERLFLEIEQNFGRLDVLFNNAGRGAPAVPMEETPFEVWKSVVDTNLTGSFLCAQAAIRLMKKQSPRGGRIINNGSVSATTPRLYSAPYTSTKHAITGLTKSIALECREFDIACCQIDVGNAVTDLSQRMRKGVHQADGSVRAEAMMDVSNVAETICYMARLPLEANAMFLTVMATKMPFVGRG